MKSGKSTAFFKSCIALLAVILASVYTVQGQAVKAELPVYQVERLMQPISGVQKWKGSEWRHITPVKINNYMGKLPSFIPSAEAKMMYDDENLYVMYRVKDKFVSSKIVAINGAVFNESAVEFFFSPDTTAPKTFFNLEINAGGTPLLGYRAKKPSVEDIQKIVIQHSLPQVVDPEITKKVTWTIFVKIPIDMLAKYANVTRPEKGVAWRANFYKIAEKTSNIHFITWSRIYNEKPNFHLPQFFGRLVFN
ncbi:MAG: carbohydrate-binding family 9-like protein [Bacteroidota bacterium]